MVETLTESNLYNSFAVFKEILQWITALTTLKSAFSSDEHYFEDEPNIKSREFSGYPLMLIETEVNDEPLTLGGVKKKFPMTTEIEIRCEYHARSNLTAYANAITDYFNTNHVALYVTYGITKVTIDKERYTDIIDDKKLAIIKLTCKYMRILSVR